MKMIRTFRFEMTTQQIALIIRECVREAAKNCECKPSEALDPRSKAAIAARNAAIVSAYRQGVPKHALSIGFRRSWETVNKALLQAGA
jgi:hypothetical protein